MDIEVEDIAHGLAFVARWNGQTRGDWPYSVAEHSLLVEDILVRKDPALAPRWRLAALLHDAPEYVIGDMISPVKAAVGPGYGALDRTADGGDPPALRPARSAARADQAGDQGGRPGVGLAGSGADRGISGGGGRQAVRQARAGGVHRLEIRLRPPAEVRADYVARVARLLDECR
jgi:uncharacterized protein